MQLEPQLYNIFNVLDVARARTIRIGRLALNWAFIRQLLLIWRTWATLSRVKMAHDHFESTFHFVQMTEKVSW